MDIFNQMIPHFTGKIMDLIIGELMTPINNTNNLIIEEDEDNDELGIDDNVEDI